MIRLFLWLSVLFAFCLMLTGPWQALLGGLFLGGVFGVRGFVHVRRSRAILTSMANRYGFSVTVSAVKRRYGPHQTAQAMKPNVFQVADGAVAIQNALTQYPASFIALCGMQRLVLCCQLKRTDNTAATQRQMDGYCDLNKSTICMRLPANLYQLVADVGETTLAKGLHHELFHLLDWKMGSWQDEVWATLNPPGFRYADTMNRIKSKPPPGFISGYATTAIHEDKAELFSFMMSDYALVKRRTLRDTVLAAKVTNLKTMLLQCCPDMDEAFWQRL